MNTSQGGSASPNWLCHPNRSSEWGMRDSKWGPGLNSSAWPNITELSCLWIDAMQLFCWMHLVGNSHGCFKTGCNMLLGGCIPNVLSGFFHLPFPQAALTFAGHKFKPRWENSSLYIHPSPGGTVIERCGSSLLHALHGWKMLGCKCSLLVARDPWGLWGDASWKFILEAPDVFQHQDERRQGPLTSEKDTEAPQLLSVVS